MADHENIGFNLDWAKTTFETVQEGLQSGVVVAETLLNGDNQNDTEDLSQLSQDEINKLKKYIFSTQTYLQYPMSVGQEIEGQPYQSHSVRFYINARDSSRVAGLTNKAGIFQDTERSWAGPVRNVLETVDSTDQNNLNGDQARALTQLTAGVAGFVTGFSVGKNVPGGFILGGGFAAAAVGGVSAVVESVSTVRTLGAIELYVAAPPTAQYSANWENKELGALAGISYNAQGADGTLASILAGAKGTGELGIRSAIKAAASLPSEFGITGDIGAAFDLASSKVTNPYKEQLFSNMGFRQFAFNYKFTPRSNDEYKQVKQIIDLFKYHMHPENDPTGLFLEYPSEFNIEYLYKGIRNEHLSKVSSCALTDIKITYGNQDAFTTFKGTDGAPAEINMQLAFTELETLTNDRIADGY